MTSEVPSKGLEWTNLILGAGLASAAFVFTGLPVAAWNASVVGALIMFSSAMALYRYGAWAEWSNLTLGIWAIVAPFMLGFGSTPTPMWTHIVIGLCVTAVTAIQLTFSQKPNTPSRSKPAPSK